MADLAQLRSAFETKYANLEWLRADREVDLDALVSASVDRLRGVENDAEAQAVFDSLIRRVNDGHVELRWPAPKSGESRGPPQGPCSGLGYDARKSRPGITAALTGYRPLGSGGTDVFPTGTVMLGAHRVGIIRIGVFQPEGSPSLCEDAVKALGIPPAEPCDNDCSDRITDWAYSRFTADFEQSLRAVRDAGAAILLVDIGGNGGGSEWAEAAARMVSGRPLVSARRGFVRGPHWTRHWRALGARLRQSAATAPPDDRARLLAWAAEADRAKFEAERPCNAAVRCDRIARAGFSTGLVGEVPSGRFAGKLWGADVFSPAQYNYSDGVWRGPLMVLVDQNTWSAAEQFAALLQDNGAAIVIGTRTGGAGCGYTNGGDPTVLSNSGALLKLPDCVRYRRNGSNEVRGVIPDHLVALRGDDGTQLKARMIQEKLAGAVEDALAMAAR